MTDGLEGIHPELRWCVEEVARQVRRRRWMNAAKRFTWFLFGITLVFTGVLALLDVEGVSGAVLLALYFWALLVAALYQAVPVWRRRISLEQVALYIDERHPELENRITSAVEFSAHEKTGVSQWLTDQFLTEALERVRTTSFEDVLDRKSADASATGAVAMVVSSVIVVYLFGSLWLPAISFVFPRETVELAALPFTVEPGDARVRKGDNQMIWIHTDDTDREVLIRWRQAGGSWQEIGAGRSRTERVYYHQFTNIQEDIEYQVQYGRRRTPEFVIATWTPPEVTSIDLTYHYPDYLRRPAREAPNSGNISGIEGTRVELDVRMNKPVAQAELVLESGERLPLERKADTRWALPITLEHDDEYRIELVDTDGAPSEYSSRYSIAVHRDKPPEIRIDFPRGDNEVTVLEEVPFEFDVSDDYGFNSYGVQYEVAGREPVRIPLNEDSDLVESANGRYKLLLEDLDLEVGDFITWTVWAEDTKPDRSEYERLGDPYFLEIRPFRREYREAVSDGGMGGMGGEAGQEEQAQKDVLIATWNLRREARYMDDLEFGEKRGIIVETQEELLQKVVAGGGMMQGSGAEILKLREAMQGSVDALTRSSLPDPKAELSEATLHQQNALRLIARMKPRQAEVTQQQGGGGGGGGMQDTPDISELEMARNRNFYEEENLTREQQEATDEVLDRIKELAKRQQGISDELAKLISELQRAKTDEERERLQRELERLEEEMRSNLERLDEARQDLSGNALNNEQTREAQEGLERARHQMNRSLEQLSRDELQQARSASARATDALEDIQEHLQQFGRSAAAQRMQALQRQLDGMRERQRGIVDDAEKARQLHQSPSFADQEEVTATQERLKAEKETLAESFVEMMEEASELADRSEQTQELMSRKLGDWMRETSRDGVYEDIQETKPLVEYGIWDTAVREEQKIAGKLDSAAERLQAVSDALVEDDLEGMQKALEQLDQLLDREEVAEALGRQGDEGGPGARAEDDAGEDTVGGGEPSGEETDTMGPGEGDEERDGPGLGVGGNEEERRRVAGQDSDESSREKTARADQGDSGADNSSQQRPGEGDSPGRQSSNETDQGASPQGRNGEPGSSSPRGGGGRFDPDRAMQNFAERGYQEWLERLRDAEAMLPQGTPLRTEVTRLRERVEQLRRDWRSRALAPQFDLFLKTTARPLADLANDLQNEIARLMGEQEFRIADDGDIPERYRHQVAEYFKLLSEGEASP